MANCNLPDGMSGIWKMTWTALMKLSKHPNPLIFCLMVYQYESIMLGFNLIQDGHHS